MSIAFDLPVASEVFMDIGPSGKNVTERFRSPLTGEPMGAGKYTITWAGDTSDGTVLDMDYYRKKYGSGASFIAAAAYYRQLASNVIFVKNPLRIGSPVGNPSIYSPKNGDGVFSKKLEIKFQLNAAADVYVTVNDAQTGAEIISWMSGSFSEGDNSLYWDGRDKNGKYLAPGVYRIGIKAIDKKGRESLIRYMLQRIFY